jgi:hypothetical protein
MNAVVHRLSRTSWGNAFPHPYRQNEKAQLTLHNYPWLVNCFAADSHMNPIFYGVSPFNI